MDLELPDSVTDVCCPILPPPVFPSSDLHYQEENIPSQRTPHICIFKRGSVLPPDGPDLDIHRRPPQKSLGNSGYQIQQPPGCEERKTSSGKSLQLVKPIQAPPHKEPKSKQRPLESQGQWRPITLPGQAPAGPLSLWYCDSHWSRQPFLSHYCLQNRAKGTPLVVQWLRLCLQCMEGFDPSS